MSQKTKFSQEIDIYGYDKRLERTHKLLKRDLSTKNYNFIKKYDQYLIREARAINFSIRTASVSFFRSYNGMRNDQDHIAHLPSSKVHKSDVDLLNKNLTILIKTAFDEHKKYCPLV